MKQLMIETFKIFYKLTGFMLFSYIFSWLYISTCNLITLYGIGLLMEGWIRSLSIVHKLFAFPWYILTTAAVLYYNYRKIPNMRDMSKEKKKDIIFFPFMIYTLASIVIFIYIRYGEELFPVISVPRAHHH